MVCDAGVQGPRMCSLDQQLARRPLQTFPPMPGRTLASGCEGSQRKSMTHCTVFRRALLMARVCCFAKQQQAIEGCCENSQSSAVAPGGTWMQRSTTESEARGDERHADAGGQGLGRDARRMRHSGDPAQGRLRGFHGRWPHARCDDESARFRNSRSQGRGGDAQNWRRTQAPALLSSSSWPKKRCTRPPKTLALAPSSH